MAPSRSFLSVAAALEAGAGAESLVVRTPAELDEAIAKLPWLRGLEISRSGSTRFTELPEAIGRLTNLESLVLAGQELQTLPDSLAQLDKLRALDVSDNHLRAMPDVLFELRALEELNIGGHVRRYVELGKPKEWGFARVDARLFSLRRLRALDLGGNRIDEVGDGIADLDALETLSLAHNPLKIVPEAIGSLRALKRLVLNGTAIGALPASLGNLRALRTLEVKDTRLVGVPPEVLALPKLDARSRKVLEGYLGNKPRFEPRWRASVPALIDLLGEAGTASLMHWITYQLRGCSHDPDEYGVWLGSPLTTGVTATPKQIYAAVQRDAPAGCACVLRSLTL